MLTRRGHDSREFCSGDRLLRKCARRSAAQYRLAESGRFFRRNRFEMKRARTRRLRLRIQLRRGNGRDLIGGDQSRLAMDLDQVWIRHLSRRKWNRLESQRLNLRRWPRRFVGMSERDQCNHALTLAVDTEQCFKRWI